MAAENQDIGGLVVKRLLWVHTTIVNLLRGHNLSLGLTAEAEDSGLTAGPRSLTAPPNGRRQIMISHRCSMFDV